MTSPPSSSSPMVSKSSSEKASARRSIGFLDKPCVFTFTIPEEGSSPLPAPRVVPSGVPKRSILKRTAPLSPSPATVSRKVTPFPEDPLSNSQFLEYPVSVILSASSTLQELIEGYNILLARIRSSIPPGFGNGFDDSNKSLFDPLREQASQFTEAVVRDLGRVLLDPRSIDPLSTVNTCGALCKTPSGLPSPRKTPTKSPKKDGLTEEQVKLGRDVCLVTSATFKLLCVILALPAVYEVFSSDQLNSILTAVLAIPLKDSLPTPNARKTYAFALAFLQQQRLPSAILIAAKDRIVFAIRRAIEGEFGREGKKGSVGDGLRAIHDFSSLHPQIFLGGFADLLQPILETLLSPIPALRIHAAHALGGLVLGITSEPNRYDSVFESMSSTLLEFFLGKDPENCINSPTNITSSLRTAIKSTEATSHALGPYWALSVLGSLIVLLGPSLHTNRRLMHTVHCLLQFGIKSRKKLIRAMTSTLWGPLIWSWRKWKDECIPRNDALDEEVTNWRATRAVFWKTLEISAQMPTAHALFATIIGKNDEDIGEDEVLLLLLEIGTATKRGGQITIDMLDLMEHLLSPPCNDVPLSPRWDVNFNAKLLPHGLFSVSPGLLTCEGHHLLQTVEVIMSEMPDLDDIRPLTEAEKSRSGTWIACKNIWFSSLSQLQLEEDETIPAIFLDLWCQIIKMRLLTCENEADFGTCAEECAVILTEVLADNEIDLRVQASPNASTSTLPATPGPASSAALSLKLGLVRQLWIALSDTIPQAPLRQAFAPMFRYLIRHASELIPAGDAQMRAVAQYSQLAAQVSMVGAPTVVRRFFAIRATGKWEQSERRYAWKAFVNAWTEDRRGSWKGAAALLGVPFDESGYWEMLEKDHVVWNGLLKYAMEKGDDEGIPVPQVLNEVAINIERLHLPSLPTATQLADDLLTSLNKTLQDTSELPSVLMDLVQDIMRVTYPPEESIKIVSRWMVRSLQQVIDACPPTMLLSLLESVQDGVCPWLADDCGVFSDEEYSEDVVPLYQTVLVSLHSLSPSYTILQKLAPMVTSGVSGATGPESESLAAFEEFWITYTNRINRPRDGWPEGFEDAVAKLRVHRSWSSDTELSSEFHDAQETERSSSDLEPDEDEDELDVISSSPLQRKSMRRSLSEKMNVLPFPRFADSDEDHSLALTTLSSSPVIATPKRQTTRSAAVRPEKPTNLRVVLQSPSTPSKKRQSTGRRSLTSEPTTGDDEEKENTPARSSGTTPGIDKVAVPDCVLGKRRSNGSLGGPYNKRSRTVTDFALNAVRRVVALSKRNRELARVASSDDSEADCSAVEGVVVVDIADDASSSSSTSPQSTPSKSSKRGRAREHVEQTRPIKSSRRDDDLPSSSDDGSSSPVGPNTPTPQQHTEVRLGYSPPSDDSVMLDSPSRDHVSRRLQRSISFNRAAALPLKTPTKTCSKKSPTRAAPLSPRASLRG